MSTEQNLTIDPSKTSIENEDGMNFIEIGKTIWMGRKIIVISIIVSSIIGLFVAISAPNEYTVTTVMVPQMSSSSKSQLGGLAALAGLDLGMAQSSDLSPITYPLIVNSVPFKLELMNSPINFIGIVKPISIFDYYTKYNKTTILGFIKKYTIGLPGVILKAIRSNPKELAIPKSKLEQPLHLTKKQFEIKKILDKMVILNVEKKDGYLTLVVRGPEPLATAQIAQKAQEILQRDITKFKVEKSQADLNFIQGRYDATKSEAERYQVNVAVNTDRFKNLTSTLPQVGNVRIQTKYNIANTVFLDLAKQLEQAKIQVKKDTPVFTIIEPVFIPNQKSKPSRIMILIFWFFFGGIIGLSIVFAKQLFGEIKHKWALT